VTSAYTWSHLIDDSAQTVNRGACQCQNAFNRQRSGPAAWTISGIVLCRYVCGNSVGKEPQERGRILLAGWQTGGILTLQSGSPFNVLQSGDSQNVEFSSWERPNLVAGVSPVLVSTRSRAMVQYVGIFAQRRNVWRFSQRPLTGSHSAHHRSFRFEDTRHGIASGAIPHGIF